MSAIKLTIVVDDKAAKEEIARLQAKLSDRTDLHEAIGEEARNETQTYLRGLNRHKTANRLGADPSNHWEKAADPGTLFTADARAATLTIAAPGIRRAFASYTILPGPGKNFLTIPAIAEAYNQRASRVPGLVAIFGQKGAGTGLLMKKEPGKKQGTIWYFLVRSVQARMDRSLLPSDADFRFISRKGAIQFFESLLAVKGVS